MKAKFDSLINDKRPVIVDFHAIWCNPCKIQSPILKEVAEELGDRIRVVKIDVDKNFEIAARYNIASVPTLMIFKNDRLLWRHSGLISKNQLYSVLMQNM